MQIKVKWWLVYYGCPFLKEQRMHDINRNQSLWHLCKQRCNCNRTQGTNPPHQALLWFDLNDIPDGFLAYLTPLASTLLIETVWHWNKLTYSFSSHWELCHFRNMTCHLHAFPAFISWCPFSYGEEEMLLPFSTRFHHKEHEMADWQFLSCLSYLHFRGKYSHLQMVMRAWSHIPIMCFFKRWNIPSLLHSCFDAWKGMAFFLLCFVLF